MAEGQENPGSSPSSQDVIKLSDFLALPENKGAFAVLPLPWCPHLADMITKDPFPDKLTTDEPCAGCGNVGENWVCLACHKVIKGIPMSHLWSLAVRVCFLISGVLQSLRERMHGHACRGDESSDVSQLL